MTGTPRGRLQLLVIAKAPVPGQVKTRLCPPCTPVQAAAVAQAALADTLDAVRATPAARRVLVLAGDYLPPVGFAVVPQRGTGLAARLANAFADTARPDMVSLLVGMDTPQLTPTLLMRVAAGLADADAVLAPATDGGWWALALADPRHGASLSGVPMSTPDTGAATRAALRERGLTVATGPTLSDVDTVADARAVAGLCPGSRFARAVGALVPELSRSAPR